MRRHLTAIVFGSVLASGAARGEPAAQSPGTQPVRESVEVSNLPLDASGALRVSAPGVAIYTFGPLQLTDQYTLSTEIPSVGYNVVGVRLSAVPCPESGATPIGLVEWEWGPGLGWTGHARDARNGPGWDSGGAITTGSPVFLWVQGQRLRVKLQAPACSSPVTVNSVTVQLRAQ